MRRFARGEPPRGRRWRPSSSSAMGASVNSPISASSSTPPTRATAPPVRSSRAPFRVPSRGTSTCRSALFSPERARRSPPTWRWRGRGWSSCSRPSASRRGGRGAARGTPRGRGAPANPSLNRGVRGDVTARTFLETPMEVRGTMRQLPLEALQAWGVVDAPLRGTGTLEIDAHGPIVAPEGEVRVTLHQVAAGAINPLDADVRIVADARRVQLAVSGERGTARLLKIDGELGAPLGAVLERQSLHDASVSLTGVVGPISVAELEAFINEGREPVGERPDGIITGRIELHGTTGNPMAVLTGRLEKLGVGKQALGTVDLDYRYADAA